MIDTSDLERLIKLCPDIALTNADIKKIIEEESYNSVISSYKKEMCAYEAPKVEAVEEDDEDFLEDEDQERDFHLEECEDGTCACRSPIDDE